MIKKFLTLIFIMSLFCSCDLSKFGPGSEDFSKSLIKDYMLFRSSSHKISIVTKSPYNDKTPIIPSKVLKLNIYKDYILAYRQGLIRRSPDKPKDTYLIPNPNEFDYWILDTKSPFVFKNLSKIEFDRIKDSLKIPKKIDLIGVYDY